MSSTCTQFMADSNHYHTLGVSPQATSKEIKQTYRRLAKRFHPDSQNETADHDKIVRLNSAYEVLSDPQRRRAYDQQLSSSSRYNFTVERQQRTSAAQANYQRSRQTRREADTNVQRWLKEVYQPVNHLLWLILNSLDSQIDQLAADPFDDQLMENFQHYLNDCRNHLQTAQRAFASQPNPAKVAGVAMNLYYCLNQMGDGIEELHMFTLSYDESYLNTGKELFRMAEALISEQR